MSESGNGGNELFRAETAISWLDLRLEVGAGIVRVAQSEDLELSGDRTVNMRGGLRNLRGSRDVTVHGNYNRDTAEAEMIVLSASKVREDVHSDVVLHAEAESEAIMGGGYTAQNVGPYFRLAGMWDTMCWGGWSEIDVVRAEIVDGAVIRSYVGYMHDVGARNAAAYHYIDDFTTRVEHFGTFNDNQTTVTESGGPGAGTRTEM